MDLNIAVSLCRELRGGLGLFGYSGPFADVHSARLIELSEALSEVSGFAFSGRGRLGYVMVEAFQNIIRHRADSPGLMSWGSGSSLFMVHHTGAAQLVVAQNAVTKSQQLQLDARLADLRDKTPEELKQLFMAGMQRAGTPGVRGAGLGLIEMVRRSGGKIAWGFNPVDALLQQFSFHVELGEVVSGQDQWAISSDVRRLMMEGRVALVYVGKWSLALQGLLLQFAGENPEAERLTRTMSPYMIHASMALFMLHGDPVRSLTVGGIMDQEQAEQVSELFARDLGAARLAVQPIEGRVLVLASLPL